MLVFHLLILSICLGVMLLSIHHHDEIHQLVALLSGFIAVMCFLILTPLTIKIILGFLFLVFSGRFITKLGNFDY